MRTFVAIATPGRGPVSAYLDESRRRLDRGHPDVKWVATDQRHITLRFLGEVSGDGLPAMKEAVGRAAAGCDPFEARLGGWGAFPGVARPQTLWTAADAEVGAFQALEKALTSELKKVGIAPERKPIHPHITLGRVRSHRGLDALVKAIQSAPPSNECAAFRVDRITLFESVLTPTGPQYTVLLEAPLGAERTTD